MAGEWGDWEGWTVWKLSVTTIIRHTYKSVKEKNSKFYFLSFIQTLTEAPTFTKH